LQLDANVLTFSASHQYLDNPTGQPSGKYTITVTVTDDGSSGTGTAQVEVDNVAPTPQSATTGRSTRVALSRSP